MKNKIVLLLLFSVISSMLFAQDSISRSHYIGYSVEVRTARFNNLSNLNSALKLYNYPQLSDYGYGAIQRVLLGNIKNEAYASLESGISAPFSNGEINNISSKLEIMDVMIDFNYNLSYKNERNQRKFLFQPFLGVGFTVSTLTIANNSNNSRSFDSTLKVLSGQKQVTTNTSYLINLGMTVQKSISKDNDWFIGLRAGYELQLNQPKWMLNNSSLSDNPRADLGGLYVGFSVSFY